MQLIEIDAIQPEAPQTHFKLLPQVFGTAHGRPEIRTLPRESAFGRDHQPVRIGPESVADQLLAHLRTIRIRCVNEVDAKIDSPAQDSPAFVRIFGFPPYAGPREAHGAETQAMHRKVASDCIYATIGGRD